MASQEQKQEQKPPEQQPEKQTRERQVQGPRREEPGCPFMAFPTPIMNPLTRSPMGIQMNLTPCAREGCVHYHAAENVCMMSGAELPEREGN